MTTPAPGDIWKQIVEHSPLVSIDLIVEHKGGIALGKRTNEPARGEWFPPGGVIQKGETFDEAIQRIAQKELGCSVVKHTLLGAYEHFYDTSEFQDVSKHYVPIAFVVESEGQSLEADSQHNSFEIFTEPFAGYHDYVQEYLDDYVEWNSESR